MARPRRAFHRIKFACSSGAVSGSIASVFDEGSLPESSKFHSGQRVGDYVITRAAETGGMGSIYEARHVENGSRVALKTVSSEDATVIEYFRQEIATLAAVSHPAVVPIVAHGIREGRPWYAMKWLEGPTLREVMRSELATAPTRLAGESLSCGQGVDGSAPTCTEQAKPVLDSDAVTNLCIEILRALDYVHSRGLVHGDLKPENIFVLGGLRPVLVDFGVSHWFAPAREALDVLPRAVGSIAYMAPEQIRGALPDARADLYALGCIWYEALTGTHPFQRDTIDATALAQLNAHPQPVSALADSVPPVIEGVIHRLLGKSPADRPGYARWVLATLGVPVRTVSPGIGEVEEPVRRPDPLYRSDIIARSTQLRSLAERMQAACAGRGSHVLVSGERGIGKTRFLLEAADLAARNSMQVVCVRCGDEGRACSFSPRGHPLARLMSEWGSAYSSVVRHRPAAKQIIAQIFEHCRGRPVLLAFDDVDRADEPTRTLVEQLLQEDLTSCALLVAYSETAAAAEVGEREGPTLLPLVRLAKSEVTSALRSMLATEFPSPTLVDHCYDRSEGNPFMLGQSLRGLLDSGLLVNDRLRGWHLATPEQLAQVPRTESEILRWRLEWLSADELELAEVAAVLGRSFELPLLAAVAARSEDEVRALLTKLRRAQIVELSAAGSYAFTHVTLQVLLYERMPEDRRTTLHRRAAIQLSRLGDHDDNGSIAGTLAIHFTRSGQDAEAAFRYEVAGREALRLGRHQAAVDAFRGAEVALERTGQGHTPSALRVAEALGDGQLVLRRLKSAADQYERALALAQNTDSSNGKDVVVSRLHRKLAAAIQHDHDAAIHHLETAIVCLGDPHRASGERVEEIIQSHLDLMFVHYWKRDAARVLEIGRHIAAMVAASGTPDQHAAFHFNLAAGLMAHNRYVTGPEELGHIDQALAHYVLRNDQLKISMSSFLRSMILLFGGSVEEAQRGFEAILAAGEKIASVTIQLRALTYLCLVHRKRRAADQVRRVAAATLALAEEHRMPEYQALAQANLAWLALRDGNTPECLRLVHGARRGWEAAATKNAFCWTALYPLLATLLLPSEVARVDSMHLIQIARDLLDGSQELPPAEVRRALEDLAAAGGSPDEHVIDCALRARDAAVRCGLL
jgi:serine/threonine protein kinase